MGGSIVEDGMLESVVGSTEFWVTVNVNGPEEVSVSGGDGIVGAGTI